MRQPREISESRPENKGGWIVNNWRSLTVLSVVVLIAFMLRVFFAYGTSAGSGFALSGGSDAVYHLHVIEQILNGKFMVTDPAINYPFGGTNYSPPLFDFAVAIFAFPLKLFGFSTQEAASIALVYSTAIIGALTCIPVYKLGKEMFNRKAGYIAAAFFAISAIAIVKTVFSNGTESAFFVFFFVLMTLFLLRAVRAYKLPADGTQKGIVAMFGNKAVFRNTLFASLSLTALILSWIGFIAVIMILSFIMVAQAVIDRLRGVSAIGVVKIYAAVIFPALLAGALYYAVLAGMTMVILGPICLAALMTLISVIISMHRIWVITIPVSIGIAAVVFLITAFFMPELHSAMTSVAYPYAEGKFGALLSSNTAVALSSQAVYAGMATMWFSFVVATYLLLKMGKKSDSPSHVFITMWFLAVMYASWKSMDLAYLAAPMYAIGTGVVIIWMLRFAKIKDYVETFKGTNVKTFWRKMIKPIPFLTVLSVVFVLIMPNVLYAVDASIPGNKKADYDADLEKALGGIGGGSQSINYLGATNYYIKDNDWTLGTAWDHFAGVSNKPALVTWLDYGAEAAARGNFNVVADHFGNGVSAASNILTGTSSDAITVMAVRLINGDPALIDKAVPGAAAELKKIICDGKVTIPGSSPSKTVSNIDYVRSNPQIFGPTDFNITEENAAYLVASDFLKKTFTDGEIAEIYNTVVAETRNEIGYIGVTGTMLPIYYGDNNLFSTIAYLGDSYLDKNSAPTKYYTAGVPWVGYYYTYKDAMYQTMIWKTLVGMSLDDYRGLTNDPGLSQNALINGLMLSDGTLKAYPGYGLGSFSVNLEEEWWVMYSPSKEAPYENWKLMNGLEAQELQATDGGTINYLGGMAFLRYDKDAALISGEVTDPNSEGVKGVTVAVFNANGDVVSTTRSNGEGRYSLMIPSSEDPAACTIGVFSGSVYSMELKTQNVTADPNDVSIDWAEIEGTLMSGTDPVVEEVEIELAGKVSEKEYSFKSSLGAFTQEFAQNVVPDTYAVTMTLNGASVYTGTFTLYPGTMNVGEINIKEVAVEVTVKDRNGALIEDAEVVIYTAALGTEVASAFTDGKGVAKMSVAPGTYVVQLRDNRYDSDPFVLVTSSSTASTTAFTAKLGTTSRVSVIMVEAVDIVINNTVAGDLITVMNGAYTPRGTFLAYLVATGGTETVSVPVGDFGKATSYTVSVKDDGGIRYYSVPDTTYTVDVSVLPATGTLDITMTYKDADGKVSDTAGVISFIDENNSVFTISVAVPDEDNDDPLSVRLPDGTYTVYAYTFLPEKKAYIGKINAEDGVTKELKIELVDAIGVSGDIRYTAATTTRLAYVPVIITTEITTDGDTVKHTIVTSTDSLGSYYVLVPKGNSYFANTQLMFGMFVKAASDVNIATATDTSDRTSRNITVNVNNTYGYDDTIDITVPSVSFSFSGNVRDVDGGALSNVTITYTVDGGFEKKVTTGTNGQFSLSRLSAGSVIEIIKLESDKNKDKYVSHMELPLKYTVTRNTSGIEIIMDKDGDDTPFFMSGLVRDTGGTTRGATINYEIGGVPGSVTATTNGQFKITGIAPGASFEITSIVPTLTTYSPYGALPAPIAAAAGTMTGVELLVESNNASAFIVSGNVTDDSTPANALVGAVVVYKLNGAEGNVTTGPGGAFRITGISSGTSLEFVRVTMEGYVLDSSLPATSTVTADVSGIAITMKVNAAEKVMIIPLAALKKDADITVGKPATADGMVTLTIDVRNNTSAAVLAVLKAENVQFRYGSSNAYVNEFVLSIPSGSSRGISVTYAAGETDLDIEIWIVSNLIHVEIKNLDPGFDPTLHELEVKQGSTVKDPVDESTPYIFDLAPGAYDITVKPKSRDAGDTGYYYSGRLTLYAGMDEFDITDLTTEVTIVTFDLTDKDDKVTMSSKGAVAAEKDEDKDPTDTWKVYYVPTDDLEDCILTVVSKEKVAYVAIDDFRLLDYEVDLEPYLGDKITITGYVGRVANGEMTITMTAGTLTGVCVVPITGGEFKADLPKDMNGVPIEYKFEAYVTDYIGGLGTEFTASRTIPAAAGLKDKQIVNTEVKIDVTPAPSSASGNFTVSGRIMEGTDNLQGAKITYMIDTKEGTTESDRFGKYSITAPIGSTIEITKVTRDGYKDLIPSLLPFTADAADVDFGMVTDVTVDQTGIVLTADGNRIKAVVTLEITNDRDSTVVLFAGKGWSMPAFDDGSGSNVNYAVIPVGAAAFPVTMTAYYDPEKIGAGSDLLSVVVKDLTGATLQTKTVDTKDAFNEGSLSDIDTEEGITTSGNRVSKNEYGFAVTFKNETDKWIDLDLELITPVPAEWYVSLVDKDNVILGSPTSITINGKSTATYFVRLILVDDWEDSDMSLPDKIELKISDPSGTGTKTVELDLSTTDLKVDGLSAGGNGIFGSMNSPPTIIWVLVVLCVLMVMLIFWLGMRRGVFLRKR